jgi:hypothetical protein
MQTPSFIKNMNGSAGSSQESDFLHTYPIVDMIRGLLISSALWFLLAVAVYAVYTMVRG